MKKTTNYNKIVCLMLMWLVGFITPTYAFDPVRIVAGTDDSELPSELKRLITDVLRPSFQSAGYFPGLLQRSEFIEKITPGQHFRGEEVLLHIDKMLKGLNGPDRQENLKVLEAICKFYVGYFKDYMYRKSFGGLLSPKTESLERARVLILNNVHAYYMFSEDTKKGAAKIEPVTKSDIQGTDEADSFLERYPVRLRLTRLIINIFMLNKEEKGSPLQKDIYRRHRSLGMLLESFHDEVSGILNASLQRGVIQAKVILQGLPEFIILLQQHALNISMWNMLVRLGQEQARKIALTAVSILGVAAILGFTWRKLMPQTTVEKLADRAYETSLPAFEKTIAEVQKMLKDAPDQIETITNASKAIGDLANDIREKIKDTSVDNVSQGKLVQTAVQAAIDRLAVIIGSNEVIKTPEGQETFQGFAKQLLSIILNGDGKKKSLN